MDIEIRDISYHYVRNHDVFRNISFSLHSGDILSILGGNGAGKSTLLNCIAGLALPASGEILIDNRPLRTMTHNEIAQQVGYIPQIHSNSFAYSVLEYVVMGRAPYISAFTNPSKDDYRIATKNMKLVGLDGMEDHIITELSGGEQQLAMIARVLTQEAKIIIFDEPANHLDYGNQYRLLDIMLRLARQGYIIVSTTHNPAHALKLGGKAAILDKENGIRIDKAEKILTEENLSAIYGIPIGIVNLEEYKQTICFPV